MDTEDPFTQIYMQDNWGHGSGEGSLEKNTRAYRKFLQRFMREQRVHSVVDLGCGDWQFSRLIDWSNIHYLGIDLVESIIQRNRQLYGRENIQFIVADIFHEELPSADLALIKDVFQHWPHALIFDFLPKLDRYRYTLITNCVIPMADHQIINADITLGDFRPLDLNAPPFNLGLSELYEFTDHRGLFPFLKKPRWRKKVLLYRPGQRT